MRDSRQFIRNLSTIRPKILFRQPNGIGLILQPMNIARKTLWKPASRIWSWSWYAMLTSKNENLMVQFIRKSMGPKLRHERFGKKEEILFFLKLIGSIIFGKEATRHGFTSARTPATLYHSFVLFKDTLKEIWSRLNWWVMSPFHLNGKNSFFTEDVHSM